MAGYIKEVLDLEDAATVHPLTALWESFNGSSLVRDYATLKYSWAVPNQAAIDIIAAQPVLEVGAGRGYWANRVKQAGGDIIATDMFPPEDHTFCEVLPLDFSTAIREYGKDRALLMVWPPLNELTEDLEALTLYREIGGRKLIVRRGAKDRGEEGCTGSDEFRKYLSSFPLNDEDITDIPSWTHDGKKLNDCLRVVDVTKK